jgi:hypothetical protein
VVDEANSEGVVVLIIDGDVTLVSAAMAEAPFEVSRHIEVISGSRIVVEVFMGKSPGQGHNMQAAGFME